MYSKTHRKTGTINLLGSGLKIKAVRNRLINLTLARNTEKKGSNNFCLVVEMFFTATVDKDEELKELEKSVYTRCFCTRNEDSDHYSM